MPFSPRRRWHGNVTHGQVDVMAKKVPRKWRKGAVQRELATSKISIQTQKLLVTSDVNSIKY